MFNKIKRISDIIFEDISTNEIKQTCQDNVQKIKNIKLEDIQNTITHTGIVVEQKFKKIIKDLK